MFNLDSVMHRNWLKLNKIKEEMENWDKLEGLSISEVSPIPDVKLRESQIIYNIFR